MSFDKERETQRTPKDIRNNPARYRAFPRRVNTFVALPTRRAPNFPVKTLLIAMSTRLSFVTRERYGVATQGGVDSGLIGRNLLKLGAALA
jgi:hypothetical protein